MTTETTNKSLNILKYKEKYYKSYCFSIEYKYIADLITFLDLFTSNNTYNFYKYSNTDNDNLVHKIKNIEFFVNLC